jgi:N-glycosylase/DNA lyase
MAVAPVLTGRWDTPGVRAGWERMWPAFEQAYNELIPATPPAGETELRQELLFCLLGGHGITYELGSSALLAVAGLDVFCPEHEPDILSKELLALLQERRYGPPRMDGSPRRYRFPARKSTLIMAARDWVLSAGSLVEHLSSRGEQERREWLLGCPGVGPKTASWILRNTGWARELAILDVHVLRAMSDHGIIPPPLRTGRDYEQLERRFLAWCERLEVAPGVFDLFLWEWQRGTLHEHASAAGP